MAVGLLIPSVVSAGSLVINADGTISRGFRQDHAPCADCPLVDNYMHHQGELLERSEVGRISLQSETRTAYSENEEGNAEEEKIRVSDSQLMGSASLFLFASVIIPFFYVSTSAIVDLAAHAWAIMEVVAGVFIAVLFYSALHELLREHVSRTSIWVDISEALFYLLLLELVLYISSKGEDRAWNVQKMRSFGIVFAHLAGFSAVELASELTSRGMKGNDSEFLRWVVPISVVIGTYVIFVVALWTIEYIRYKHHLADEVYDAEEQEMAHHSITCENDAAGACLGFIIGQLARFYIAGDTISGMVGKESNSLYSKKDIALLWCVVATALLVTFLLGFLAPSGGHHVRRPSSVDRQEATTAPGIGARAVHILDEASNFTAGICTMYAVRWEIQHQFKMPEPDILCYLIALAISAQIAFGFMFLMTFVSMMIRRSNSDEDGGNTITTPTQAYVVRGIFNLIQALGVLFGFTIERAFERALEDLAISGGEEASGSENRRTGRCNEKCEMWAEVIKWGGAVLLSIAIFPMLLFTIVPTSIQTGEVASKALGQTGIEAAGMKGRTRASMFVRVDTSKSEKLEAVQEEPTESES